MDHLEQLQKAVAGSADHQARLQAVKSEEEAISAILEIAGAEGIALERADLERQIEAAKENAGELSDGELEAVSGGWAPRGGWGPFIGFSVITVGINCLRVAVDG